MQHSHHALGLVPVVLGIGLGMPAHTPTYTALDEQGDPLRSVFNADVGKVRVLMLVAPT